MAILFRLQCIDTQSEQKQQAKRHPQIQHSLNLWLSMISANARRRYICNVFSHWLRPYPADLTEVTRTQPCRPHVGWYMWIVRWFTKPQPLGANKHRKVILAINNIKCPPEKGFFCTKPLMCTWQNTLTHCGLVTPYGDTNLGQQWLR